MEIKITSEKGWIEQHGLRSGPIEKPGNSTLKKHGLLFLAENPDSNSASSIDVNPDDLLGAVITEAASGKTYEIFGGYFYQRSSSGGSASVVVSKVFGVAANSSEGFNIQNGGSQVLADEWVFQDTGSNDLMDEREEGHDEGWALIVTHFPTREEYPPSGGEVGVTKEQEERPCPELGSMTNNVDADSATEQTRTFNISSKDSDNEFETYTWEIRDNNKPADQNLLNSGSGKSITHTFPKPGDYSVKVTAEGPGECSANPIPFTFNLEAPPREEPCPEIKEIVCEDVKIEDGKAIYKFTVSLKNERLHFSNYNWNFAGRNVTGSKTESFTFQMTDQEQNKLIKVEASGKNDCKDNAQLAIKVPALEEEKDPPKPSICRWLWMISALIAGLFVSSIIITSAHIHLSQNVEAASNAPIISLTIISLLFFGMMILWHMIGDKNNCRPTMCDYIEVSWSGITAGLMLTFFLASCFANYTMVVTLLGILLIILIPVWAIRCKSRVSKERGFTLLGISVLAFIISYIVLASPMLECCYSIFG